MNESMNTPAQDDMTSAEFDASLLHQITRITELLNILNTSICLLSDRVKGVEERISYIENQHIPTVKI